MHVQLACNCCKDRDLELEVSWYAESKNCLQAAKPSTLAGLLCGLLSPEHMRRAGPVASQAPSSDLVTMIDHLSGMSMALARAQGMHRVAAPVVVDLRCGLSVGVHLLLNSCVVNSQGSNAPGYKSPSSTGPFHSPGTQRPLPQKPCELSEATIVRSTSMPDCSFCRRQFMLPVL
jgi:hypothetical protein